MKIHPEGNQAKIRITYTPIDINVGHLASIEYDLEGNIFTKEKILSLNKNPKLEICLRNEATPGEETKYEWVIIDLVSKKILSPDNHRFHIHNFTIIKKDNSYEGILIGKIRRYIDALTIDAEFKMVGVMPFIPEGIEYDSFPTF